MSEVQFLKNENMLSKAEYKMCQNKIETGLNAIFLASLWERQVEQY